MPFALPLALELVGVVQVQLLAEHKRQASICSEIARPYAPVALVRTAPEAAFPARSSLRSPHCSAVSISGVLFFQLSGAFKVPQKDVRFPEKFLSHITFQAENNVLRAFRLRERIRAFVPP